MPDGQTQRAIAEPVLNAWLKTQLPAPKNVFIKGTWNAQEGVITLQDVGLQPFDLLEKTMPNFLKVLPNTIDQNSPMILHQHFLKTSAPPQLQTRQSQFHLLRFSTLNIVQASKGNIVQLVFVIELERQIVFDGDVVNEN